MEKDQTEDVLQYGETIASLSKSNKRIVSCKTLCSLIV